MVYPDSKFGHSLDNFPRSDNVTDDCRKKVGMLKTHLLSEYYAGFSFPSHPTFELKWSISLSSVFSQKLYEWTPPGYLGTSVLHPSLDEVHPTPFRFQLYSAGSPWPRQGVYSKSCPHTLFLQVVS